MAAKLSVVVVVICFVATTLAASQKIGDMVTVCSIKDPNLGDCILMKAKELFPKIIPGVKDWGLLPLDPLFVTQLELQSSGNNAVNLELSGNNVSFFGLGDTDIQSAKADAKNLQFELTMLVPNFTGSGQYKAKGKIMLLPISGNGSCSFTYEQLQLKLDINFKKVEKKGKKYLKIDKVHYGFIGLKKLRTHFDNLFNNKQLSDEMNQIMAQNSKGVFAELKDRLEDTFSALMLGVWSPMFDRIPLNELFTDTE